MEIYQTIDEIDTTSERLKFIGQNLEKILAMLKKVKDLPGFMKEFGERSIKEMLYRLGYIEEIPGIKEMFAEHYNGYNIARTNVYNCYSVTGAIITMLRKYPRGFDMNDKIVVDDIFNRYWYETGYASVIEKMLSPFRYYILLKDLIDNKPVESALKRTGSAQVAIAQLIELYKDIAKSDKHNIDPSDIHDEDTVLSFLVILGYLTRSELKPNSMYKLMIPNKEIRAGLKEINDKIYEDILNKNKNAASDACAALENLFTAKKEDIKPLLTDFMKFFQKFLYYTDRSERDKEGYVSNGSYLNERHLHFMMEI